MIHNRGNIRSSFEWQRWFAWHPVQIETEHLREGVWLETVERRRIDTRGGSHWEYRNA